MLYSGEHQSWEGNLICSPPRRIVSRSGIWAPGLSDPLRRQWQDIRWDPCLDICFQIYVTLSELPGQDVRESWRLWARRGSQETPGITGKFGLGVQNEAGQRLIEFCQENALVTGNTLFQQHKRSLYTWTSPAGPQNYFVLKVLILHI